MRSLIFALAGTLAFATAAAAQTPPRQGTPTPTPRPIPHMPRVDRYPSVARSFMLDRATFDSAAQMRRSYRSASSFVGCANRMGAKQLGALLDQVPGSTEEKRTVGDLVDRYRVCAIGTAYTPVAILRGAAAEVLDADRKGTALPKMARTLDVERYRKFSAAAPVSASKDLTDPVLRLQRVAQCHAVLAPGLSRDVLARKQGSIAEKDAFKKLYQTAPACGGPIWPSRISLPYQRAMLAEAVYHWTRSNAAPSHAASVDGVGFAPVTEATA